MPYKTVIEESGKESIGTGMGEVRKELKHHTGGLVKGFIGKPPVDKEYHPENLTDQAMELKAAYVALLQEVIIPPRLFRTATPQENREAVFLKMDRLTLEELKRFIPKEVKVSEVNPQEVDGTTRAEINRRWRDISP